MLSEVRRIVTSTSTRVPGTTNPATPMTSLTRTDIARMPRGIAGGRPAPASIEASLFAVMGSFSSTAVSSPRWTTLVMSPTAPVMGLPAGQDTTFTSAAVSSVPMAIERAATTTDCRARSARAGMPEIAFDRRQSWRWWR